jgi:hypothetical protein
MSYCVRCRDALSHRIARGKENSDAYRQYRVLSKNTSGKIRCACEVCGYEWLSNSKDAQEKFRANSSF